MLRVDVVSADLACHPSTSAGAAHSVTASARRHGDHLDFRFQLDGDLGRVVVPPSVAPKMTIGLWEHTCFEVFVARDGTEAYHEINLSPSGEWAVFAFQRYREIAPLPDGLMEPTISVNLVDGRLHLDATIFFDRHTAGYTNADLRLGLAAVIEAGGGGLSYWAIRHPVGQPDFHHISAFALEL